MDYNNISYNDLLNSIEHWNEYRVPILKISQPDKNLNFQGAMRFYFQDAGQKVATKCVNVTSADTTKDVIDVLIEKFRPDMRMLSVPEYGLYEIHENGDERKLEFDERPLFVQLEWNNDDREGRFLLRRMDEKTRASVNQSEEPSLKRKLSKKEQKKQAKIKKQQQKEKEKADAAAIKLASKNKNGIAQRLYNELPETSFTRSISNPEAVMKRRRAQKLEKRLQEFSLEGGQDAGGTLRIFGEAINKDVSYKTLLLSTKDTASYVVKQILEKYGKEDEDPSNYCLVQLIVPQSATSANGDNNSVHELNTSSGLKESILEDTDCPLLINQNHDKSRGILTFHIRQKPADYQKRRKKKQPSRAQIQQNSLHPLVVQQLNQRLQMNSNSSEQYRDQNSPQNSSQTSGSLNHDSMHPPPPSFETVHSMPTMFPSTNGNVLPPYIQSNTLNHPQYQHSMSTSTLPSRFSTNNQQQLNGNHISSETLQRQNYSHQNVLSQQGRLPVPSNQNLFQSTMHAPPSPQTSIPQNNQAGTNSQILPALIQVEEDLEDVFLSRVISHIEPLETTFRLAPTYVIYMVSRYRASTLFHPELQAPKRAELFMPFTKKIATMIRETIEVHMRDSTHLAFWLSNSSDLSHFYKQDKHLSPFTIEAQEILYDSIKASFRYLLALKQNELDCVLNSFFVYDEENETKDQANSMMSRPKATTNSLSPISKILDVLNETMATLRKNRVNAALSIQIFSHLFHHISKWLFDRLIGVYDNHTNMMKGQSNYSVYCNRFWGEKLNQRLAQIGSWAEKQGIEQAADFHLAKVTQVTLFFAKRYPERTSPVDIKEACDECDRLNPVQLRALLQRYQPETQTVRAIIQNFLYTMDYSYMAGEFPLEEDFDLKIPFLIPDDGSSELVRYIPNGLLDFVSYLSRIRVRDRELCIFRVQPSSSGFWTIYFKNNQPDEPEIIVLQLRKKNNSMGLSIIGARASNQDRLGIYIKNVVKDGSAAMDGRLQAGDQLLEVDGNSLVGIPQERAAELMQRTGPLVTLKIAKQAAIYHNVSEIINSVPSQTVLSAQASVPINFVPPAPIEHINQQHQIQPTAERRSIPSQIHIPIQIVGRHPSAQQIQSSEVQHDPRLLHFQQQNQSQDEQFASRQLQRENVQHRMERIDHQQQVLPPEMLFQPPPPTAIFSDHHAFNQANSATSPMKSPKKVSWVDNQPHQSLHTLIPPSPSLNASPIPLDPPSPPPENSGMNSNLNDNYQNGSNIEAHQVFSRTIGGAELTPLIPTHHLLSNGQNHVIKEEDEDEDDNDNDDDGDDDDDDEDDDDDNDADHLLHQVHINDQIVRDNLELIEQHENRQNGQKMIISDNIQSNNNTSNNNNNNSSNQHKNQPNSNGQLDTTAESLTLEDIDEVLSSKTHNNWLENTAGVIGTQEVYNDPRQRIVKEKERSLNPDVNIEKLSFQEKLKMFNISAKK